MRLTIGSALLLAAVSLPGCGGPSNESAAAAPPALQDADAVAKCLPAGVTLETKVSDKDGDSETVKGVLTRYQAKVKNKKLFDLNGREFYFYKSTARGLALGKDKEYNKLRKRYTVVVYVGG